MTRNNTDLHVERRSECLKGAEIDFVVSGSIGAMEAPKVIRWLRRFGANVHVYLTDGGAQFITPLTFEWASNNPVNRHFSGLAPHIANSRMLVVAPASANFIAKAAAGITDSPALALFSSHLGTGSKVLVLPNMHDSLSQSPIFQNNLSILQRYAQLLEPRIEEGKHKFPDPEVAANDIAHHFNKAKTAKSILLTAGGTYADIDIARHIGNKSSGRLGQHLCEEWHRQGYSVDVILGTHEVSPKSARSITSAAQFSTMAETLNRLSNTGAYDAIVCAAAISDFVPDQQNKTDKFSTADHSHLTIELRRTPKLLSTLKGRTPRLIAFKYLPNDRREDSAKIAADYCNRFDLDAIVVNFAGDVTADNHRAIGYTRDKGGSAEELPSRAAIATFISQRANRPPSGDRR